MTTKGKTGIAFKLIALLAFAFALLNQPVAVLLVVGFAILAERDEWLTKQTLQALILNAVYLVCNLVFNLCFGFCNRILVWIVSARIDGMDLSVMNDIMVVFSEIQGVLYSLLYVALIAFSVIAIIRLVLGKDAKVPLIEKLASYDFAKKEAAAADAEFVETPETPAAEEAEAPAEEAEKTE